MAVVEVVSIGQHDEHYTTIPLGHDCAKFGQVLGIGLNGHPSIAGGGLASQLHPRHPAWFSALDGEFEGSVDGKVFEERLDGCFGRASLCGVALELFGIDEGVEVVVGPQGGDDE